MVNRNAFIAISLLFTLLGCDQPAPSPASTPPKPQADPRAIATAKLLAMTDWPEAVATARLCEQADLSKLTPAVKAKCAETHLSIARSRLKEKNTLETHRALNAAAAEGASKNQRKALETSLRKIEADERARQRRIERAAGAIARVAFANVLREQYLDKGLDIEVKVSGTDSDRVTLEYALFNAVWAHNFQKGDLLQEMKRLGFKRVDLTDNYDYHVYWDLK